MPQALLGTADELWELFTQLNDLGRCTSVPVVSENGVFWMAFPYEDGDCLYVGMESGDPRERFEYPGGEAFYPVTPHDDPVIVYPLRVLWTGLEEAES